MTWAKYQPSWYYNWAQQKTLATRGVCNCGCTGFWRFHYELLAWLIFNKDLS